MKTLRVVSAVVVISGIFVWLLTPFVNIETLLGDQGLSASSLMSGSAIGLSEYLEKSWKGTPLFWMPLWSILSLCLAPLDLITKNSGKHLMLTSSGCICVLVGGGMLTSFMLKTLEKNADVFSSLVDVRLSVGYYLLVGIFIILWCLAYAMKKEKEKENNFSATASNADAPFCNDTKQCD